jgi:hypothetical protein
VGQSCRSLGGCRPALETVGPGRAIDPTIAVRRVNIVDFDSPIATQELWGVSALPHVRIVGPDQVVRWEGTASPDEVMQRLRQRR